MLDCTISSNTLFTLFVFFFFIIDIYYFKIEQYFKEKYILQVLYRKYVD